MSRKNRTTFPEFLASFNLWPVAPLLAVVLVVAAVHQAEAEPQHYSDFPEIPHMACEWASCIHYVVLLVDC